MQCEGFLILIMTSDFVVNSLVTDMTKSHSSANINDTKPASNLHTAGLSVVESPRVRPKFSPEPDWWTEYHEDGNDIRLRCSTPIQGLDIRWTKDGQQVDTERVHLLDRNQTLNIFDPKVHDQGYYNCSLWDQGHMTDSHQGFITVHEVQQVTHPRIVAVDPLDLKRYTRLGDSAYFSCQIDVGSPVSLLGLQSEWLWMNGTTLPDNDKYEWNEADVGNVRQLNLTVHNVTESDLGQYVCYGKNAYNNDSRVFTLQLEEDGYHNDQLLPLPTIIGLASGGFLLLVIISTTLSAVVYRSRHRDTVAWEKPDLDKFDVPDFKIEYDAFVSYSSEDEEWVKGQLFTQMEGQGYRVNIDFKDFVPGMAVAENIMDAIYKSRKTIVVMSKNFLKSMWGQFELQQAHNKAITQRKDVLILIKYGKCKVPGKLMGKTFLDWTDPSIQPHFWTRLSEAVGQPGGYQDFNEENVKLDQVEHVDELEKMNKRIPDKVHQLGRKDSGIVKDDAEERLLDEQTETMDDLMDEQTDVVGERLLNKRQDSAEERLAEKRKILERMTSDYSSGTSDYGESEEVFADVPFLQGTNGEGPIKNSDYSLPQGNRLSTDSYTHRPRISTETDSRVSCTSETQGLLS